MPYAPEQHAVEREVVVGRQVDHAVLEVSSGREEQFNVRGARAGGRVFVVTLGERARREERGVV